MADPQLNPPTADPALQPLIESLAGNVPPQPPGYWPPAPIDWIAFIIGSCVILCLLYLAYRGRGRRRFLKALRRVRAMPEGPEQLTRLHALLRNAAAGRNPALQSLSDDVFALRIADALKLDEPPAWVNAHYRPSADVRVDWTQVEQLIRGWCR